MCVTSRRERALNLAHHRQGVFDVFKHCIALRALEQVAWERKSLGGSHDVDAMQREKVHVDVPGNLRAGSANVKIPAPQRRSERSIRLPFARIHHGEKR